MAFDDGVKTVSGSVAHTDDAATKVPFVSVKCGIAPTLTGKSAIECTKSGVNLFDKSTATIGKYINVNGQEATNIIKAHSVLLPLKPSTTYYMSGHADGSYYSILALDKDMNVLSTWYGGASKTEPFTATTPNNARWCYLNFNADQIDTVIFAESATAISFEAYDGTTSTVNLGRTIYGGTADIVTGEGTDENGNDFTFTPITPTPETVGKVNNVYCDTGDTEVTYYDNAHGFSEVTVNKTGKNLFDISKVATTGTTAGISWSVSGNEITISGTATSSGWKTLVDFKLPHKGTYHFHMNATGNVGYFLRGWTQLVGKDVTEVCNDPSQTYRIAIAVATSGQSYSGTISEIQIEVGDSYTEYEPYEVVSKTAYLHKVIYGGQADVVKGTCKPKNLFDDSTFPRTATDNTYYAQFQSNLAEGNKYKIPAIHIEPDVAYVLSFNVECNTEPFNASVGIGIGSYSRDIANANNNTSGRISVPFTLTSALKEQYGDILSFRVPRYSTPREFTFTISNVQLEKASTASEYAPHFEPFSFSPISIGTDEGENTLFANEGDSAITYRKAVD